MWLITDFGFFSIVAKPGDAEAGLLTVRARVRGDLEALGRLMPTMGPILEGVGSDYVFRAQAPRAVVAAAVAQAIQGIAYANMKAWVHKSQGPAREAVLHDVWHSLHTLQRS